MPSNLKRKSSPGVEADGESAKRRFAEAEEAPENDATVESSAPVQEMASEEAASDTPAAPKPDDRAARFAALRARNTESRKANLKETTHESRRQATDPTQLTALNRKRDIAQHKLLKADTEAAGDDFERKRAWDWTVEESERWDKKMGKKEKHRDDVAFQDYRQDARKVYKRQIGQLEKAGLEERKEAYEAEKREAIERSVRSGGLEIVETEEGELIAVDKDGAFYSTADSTAFVENKPDRAAVDRLVEDIRKAEEVRLKKRRDRGKGEDEADVTYINDKNKQFNQKLARFYNKYTADIRESFERGTAI